MIVDSLYQLKSVLRSTEICIDNAIFKLHYRISVAVILGFTIIVTCKQFFGDPINCITDDSVTRAIDAYCWSNIFTVPDGIESAIGTAVPHAGIRNPRSKSAAKFHTYYQWVWIVLPLQALLCYLPHLLWKSFENRRMRTLVSCFLPGKDYRNQYDKTAADSLDEMNTIIMDHFVSTMRQNNLYAFVHHFCELLNFLNVILQLYIMDSFLGFEFMGLGLNLIKNTGGDAFSQVDSMSHIFPTVGMCEFRTYGPSGQIVNHGALCVLPLNIIHEKIYICMWFWFLSLGAASAVQILLRLTPIFCRNSRVRDLCEAGMIEHELDVATIKSNFTFGDYFVLFLFRKNIPQRNYRDFVLRLEEFMKAEFP